MKPEVKKTTVLSLTERTPIHSVEAEMGALGSMILSTKVCTELCQRLEVEDFYRPVHQTVFRALKRLVAKGTAVDMITLPEELGTDFDDVGGQLYLWELCEHTPAASSGPHYASLVQDLAAERRLEQAALDILAFSRDTTIEPSEKVTRGVSLVSAVRTSDAAFRHIGETIGNMPKGKRECLNTPWPALDALTSWGGFTKGEPHGIMAETGKGKTLVGIQLARHWCKQGKAVAFVSLELSREDLEARLMFQETGAWSEGHAASQNIPDVWAEKVREVATWGLHVADYSTHRRSDIHLEGVVSDLEAANAAQRFDVVVIDYLQLLRPKQRMPVFEALPVTAHEIRWITKRAKFCTILLMQGKTKDGELVERGSLEVRETLGTMVDLDRKEPSPGNPGHCRFKPTKMRHGAQAAIDLEFTRRLEFVQVPEQACLDGVYRGGE